MQTNTFTDNYDLLVTKLRDFKRKYYLNEITKGSIYFSGTLIVSYLGVTGLEYLGQFDSLTRGALFYGYIGINSFILGRYLAMPLMSLYGLRKSLSYSQAAAIIGTHFSEVQDKLLNTLQLHEQASKSSDPFTRELIEASISQKITELRPVPFVRAVDKSRNRKYFYYAMGPVTVLIGLMLWAPGILRDSTTRLVAYNKFFEKEAPFQFILVNDNLKAIRQQDYTLNLKVTGKELPAEVFLMIDGVSYHMNGKNKNDFTFTIKNLQKTLELQFSANGFTSRPYELKVLPKPVLQKFDLTLDYPAYLGKKQEIIHNTGDLTIPAGTVVTWKFYTENTEAISLAFNNNKGYVAERKGENTYTFRNRFMQDDHYFLKTSNQYIKDADSIEYHINVIPDAYPSIKISEQQDSMHSKSLYFIGEIADDYGLSRLAFHYKINRSDDSARLAESLKSKAISIYNNKLSQTFLYSWDLNDVQVRPGDEIEYYFEVWDNDGFGSKSARSQKLFFKAPSSKELEKTAEANSKELQSKMESAIRQANQMQKDMQKTRMDMLNKKSLDWQDRKRISDLLDKQKNLENTIKDIQDQYKKNVEQQKDYNQLSPELLEKHQKLQDMLQKVMDPETKKMLEELQKLLQENNKDQIQNNLDKMKLGDKEVQKEIDRMMELYKQLEFEQKLDQTAEKLYKLAEKQDKLADDTQKKDDKGDKKNDADNKDKKGDKDNKDGKDAKDGQDKQKDLQEKQKQLADDFKDVKKDLQELEKKNEELEKKNDMDKTDEEQQDIQNELDNSNKELEKNQNSKASKSQKKAAKKMNNLSQKLKDMKQKMAKEAHEEDYQALRQILKNLVYTSMEQEKLMADFKQLTQYNPQYVELSKKQRKLKDDAKMIEDSLLALSKRVVELKSYVNKEIGEINFNMQHSIDALSERNTGKSLQHQQFAMTSLNNLALMLSEAMQQMQENMKENEKESNGKSCPNPKKKGKGGSKPNMSKMKEMQDQLSKELGEMKKMQDGKEGKEGQQAREQLSKRLAEGAAKQESIRRQIQKMNEDMNKNGKKPLGDLDQMQKDMDKNEEDIVNRRITDETIKRQHDIMVRMLEAEKAEKEQEMDNERKAVQAKEHANTTPPQIAKYLQAREKEVEMLRNVPPSLNPYYRQKVKEYFDGLK